MKFDGEQFGGVKIWKKMSLRAKNSQNTPFFGLEIHFFEKCVHHMISYQNVHILVYIYGKAKVPIK